MPEAVISYLKEKSIPWIRRKHLAILHAYENDFNKYAKKTQVKYIQLLFDKIPEFLAKHVKFAKIDPYLKDPNKKLKPALKCLIRAGIVHQVYATHANGVPLKAQKIEKKMKTYFLDIGLLQTSLGTDYAELTSNQMTLVNGGAFAEQFVGQELLAYLDPFQKRGLYFWERLKPGSSAEVDFVMNISGRVVPIEVKAGKTGRLLSLKQFLKEKKIPYGVRISELPLALEGNILTVPFYLISELPRLLRLI